MDAVPVTTILKMTTTPRMFEILRQKSLILMRIKANQFTQEELKEIKVDYDKHNEELTNIILANIKDGKYEFDTIRFDTDSFLDKTELAIFTAPPG